MSLQYIGIRPQEVWDWLVLVTKAWVMSYGFEFTYAYVCTHSCVCPCRWEKASLTAQFSMWAGG